MMFRVYKVEVIPALNMIVFYVIKFCIVTWSEFKWIPLFIDFYTMQKCNFRVREITLITHKIASCMKLLTQIILYPQQKKINCYFQDRHKGIKKFPCDFCEKRFFDNGKLKVHRRIHTGERPYKCCVCEKTFVQSKDLKLHKEKLHPTLF